MNNLDLSSLVPGFETSSESDFMHEYTTTMSSREVETDQNLFTSIEFRVGVGAAVFLMILIIFRIIKSHYNREREDRGIFRIVEEYGSSLGSLQNEESSSHGEHIQLQQVIVINRNRAEQEESQSSTSFNLNPQQNEGTISHPESYDESLSQNYQLKQGTAYGPALHGKHENRKDPYTEFFKGSPASFSTPRESREGLLLPTKSESIGPESSKNMEDKSSEEINVPLSEDAARKTTPLPKKGSQSSPTSPNPLRRRFASSEDTPQRPSSWI